jgi:DNA-binding transcriptional MocR family regulator
VNDDTVFQRALAGGVAVVPGWGFFVGPGCHSCLRLNYTNQTENAIRLGVTRLAEAVKG